MSVAVIDDTALVAPVVALLATNMTAAKGGRTSVTTEQLSQAITLVTLAGTIKGASTLVVTIDDPEWVLLDSGFFDADKDGYIDKIVINYPAGSRYNWQLSQISPRADHSIVLTFMDRVAAEALRLDGTTSPMKANRAAMTRAEFIKALFDATAKASGLDIEFYCGDLATAQAITGGNKVDLTSTLTSSKKPAGAAAKTSGLSDATTGLTCKGSPLTSGQKQIANIALAVGKQLNAPTAALEACIYAAMGESSLAADSTTYTNGTGGAQGPWQAEPGDYSNGRDTEGMANAFYTGGKDFQQGGAIVCARRGDPVWMIANEVEANAVWGSSRGDSYEGYFPGGQAQGLAEAAAIVAAGGGGSIPPGASSSTTTTTTTVEAYTFEVNPHETYWDCAQRLATEVNWELCLDGNRVYYDSDQRLITQTLAATIYRGDLSAGDATFDWSCDWDARQVATNFSLTLCCEPFDFWPGEVVQLVGFGPASSGSTASPHRLPGRWLIQDSTRNFGDLTTVFTLIQPTKVIDEPAPQVSTSTKTTATGPAAGTPAAAVAAAQRLSAMGLAYPPNDVGGARDGTAASPPAGTTMDCSGSTGWILTQAGFTAPGSPTDVGVAADYLTWGDAGPGKQMTIWCSTGHVFIEFYLTGQPHMQANTSNGNQNGPRYIPWGNNGENDAGSGQFTARHPAGC
jgi:hypothetical protein